MLLASLIPFAFFAIASGAGVPIDTIISACRGGQHCIYGPGAATRNGQLDVVVGGGKRILQSAVNGRGEGTWLIETGGAGHIGVQCKKSNQVETWYFYFDQPGGVHKLVGSDQNNGVALVRFSGMNPVKGGNEEQSRARGIDIFVTCP